MSPGSRVSDVWDSFTEGAMTLATVLSLAVRLPFAIVALAWGFLRWQPGIRRRAR